MEKDLLHKFFNGNTTLSEEIKIRKWLQESKENEILFFEERILFDQLLLIEEEQPEKIQKENKTSFLTHRIRTYLKIASIFLLGVISASYLKKDKETVLPITQYSISIPTRERSQIILPDGSEVWLNTHASLNYSNDYGINHRTVQLEGEAFFEIKKDENNPFIVESPFGTIEALGTSFNVAVDRRNEKMETTLVDGKVKVSSLSEKHFPVILEPGQKVVITKDEMDILFPEKNIFYHWKENQLDLDDVSFDELITIFSSYFNIDIEINNSNIKSDTCSGKFRHHDGVYYALRVLQKRIDFKFNLDIDENKITIY